MPSIKLFKQQSVLVVGDIMVDKYIMGEVERISPEAPVPVLLQRETQRKIGGCGNVAMNILSLGGKVRIVASIGKDTEGELLKSSMVQAGANVDFILPLPGVPTITKTRVVSRNQQFLRIDDEVTDRLPEEAFNYLQNNIDKLISGITAVVLSDYGKGFLSPRLCELLISQSRQRGIPVIVDPKGRDCSKYRGATVVTPNAKEFVEFTTPITLIDSACFLSEGLRLCRMHNLRYLFVTRSEHGISVIDAESGTKSDFPTRAQEVIDVTGAGDTVVATLALSLGSGIPAGECAELCNQAASIVVSKFGAAQVGYIELLGAINFGVRAENGDSLAEIARLKKEEGKKIVFTNGCFDIVHAGHVSSFRQAREFGDVLVVGLNSDESIRRLKGDKRPIVGLEHRRQLLSSIRYIDYVIPFEEDTPENLIQSIRPDVLVKGKEWKDKEVAGSALVTGYGGKIEFISLEDGLSTTEVIRRIRQSFGEGQ